MDQIVLLSQKLARYFPATRPLRNECTVLFAKKQPSGVAAASRKTTSKPYLTFIGKDGERREIPHLLGTSSGVPVVRPKTKHPREKAGYYFFERRIGRIIYRHPLPTFAEDGEATVPEWFLQGDGFVSLSPLVVHGDSARQALLQALLDYQISHPEDAVEHSIAYHYRLRVCTL